LRAANIQWKYALMIFLALWLISPFTAAQTPANGTKAQNPTAEAKPAAASAKVASGQLPKIWRREGSLKEFRVEFKGDVFHAEWINIPAAAAKDGTFMRIECRKTGTKWVGSSSVYQGIANPKAPAGEDTKKMCHLTSRFEVDSVTPEKITFHTEALRDFDYAKCQVLKTAWEEFTWVPKK